jgi:hypothetical protein
MRRFAAVLAASVAAGCADGDAESKPRWTEPQAESITTVRGTEVRVDNCRGVGASEVEDGSRLYGRFECLAGARRTGERYDTVAVAYVLRPLAEYEGAHSRHRLDRVRFVGGPGVP